MRNNQDGTRHQLTHDELKAAEAAFQGRHFNEAWSQAARTTYDGILIAKMKLNHERLTRGVLASKYDPRRAAEQPGVVQARAESLSPVGYAGSESI